MSIKSDKNNSDAVCVGNSMAVNSPLFLLMFFFFTGRD